MNNLLEIKNLKKHFLIKTNILFKSKQKIYAVNDVSFSIKKNETIGLVGESGCGKSTIGRLISKLIKQTDGEIFYNGKNIINLTQKQFREFRKKIQIVFQDPYSSLNPRKTVFDILASGIRLHKMIKGKKQLENRVKELLELVGLSGKFLHRFPHEFSGGQRQRIGIARAISMEPEFIICDEPVSALDVSVQAQVINLLEKLKNKMGLTLLFIAHDLAVVKHVSDRIIVMYLGKIMEMAPKDELFANPLHPYTKALISAIPIPDPKRHSKRILLEGDIEAPTKLSEGCIFSKRCYEAKEECFINTPLLREIKKGHFAYCHFAK